MGTTSIPWCDYTFNPWRGCTKISLGCKNCYAESMDRRQLWGVGRHWGADASRAVASSMTWRLPHVWNRAAQKSGQRPRVFCASMCDVAEDRPDLVGPRGRLVDVIENTPHLDWLLLSKRPENFDRLFKWFDAGPPPNVWLGTSVEGNEVADRVGVLRRQRARVRFLSVEPLLERVTLPLGEEVCPCCANGLCSSCAGESPGESCRLCGAPWSAGLGNLPGIDWVIAGGESGPAARPCAIEWIADVVSQCWRAGAAPFVKQLGSRPFTETSGRRFSIGVTGKGEDPREWPEDCGLFSFEPGDASAARGALRCLPINRNPPPEGL